MGGGYPKNHSVERIVIQQNSAKMVANRIFGIEQVIPDHKKKSYNPPISVDDIYEVIDEILILEDSEMSRVKM